jgi:hypothetical protein
MDRRGAIAAWLGLSIQRPGDDARLTYRADSVALSVTHAALY